MEKKTCSKCGRELPLTGEYFNRKKRNKDGFNHICKECNGGKFSNKEKPKSKIWTCEEIELLKSSYSVMDKDQLVKLFDGRTYSSISNKASELKLVKYIEKAKKEGYQICKKCNRELPWTYQYFPVVRAEKNPRRICRECNPKYNNFLSADSEMRMYWSSEDEKRFTSIYPHYTNEELINKYYPDLSEKQLTDKAWHLGISKSDETYWRGRKQQAPKVSAKLKGVPKTEEQKRKLSETKKRQYAEGICISPWKGRIVSEEEKEKTRLRVKGRWSGKSNPRHKNPLFGANNGRWSGGITNISTALRENIYEWKQESMKLCNYKCIFTGGEFDNIHHLTPFNNIIKESLNELGLIPKSSLGEYIEEDRNSLIKLVQDKHKKYGLGLCMNKDIHKLFHDIYSYINSDIKCFKEFLEKYFNGEFDDLLKDELKSINSRTNFEEAKKLASFYYA